MEGVVGSKWPGSGVTLPVGTHPGSRNGTPSRVKVK
jgi:hypothetical protein